MLLAICRTCFGGCSRAFRGSGETSAIGTKRMLLAQRSKSGRSRPTEWSWSIGGLLQDAFPDQGAQQAWPAGRNKHHQTGVANTALSVRFVLPSDFARAAHAP